MILHWEQIVLHYGKNGDQNIKQHKEKLAKAHQSTYGLLYSHVNFDEIELKSSGGGHAEEKIIASDAWQKHIPRAISQQAWGTKEQFNVIIALNRSPCGSCTRLLVNALGDIQRRYPLRAFNNRFILASLGAYGAYNPEPGDKRTSVANLTALKNAGWELCVLQVGSSLTRDGSQLATCLETIGFKGFMRLSS